MKLTITADDAAAQHVLLHAGVLHMLAAAREGNCCSYFELSNDPAGTHLLGVRFYGFADPAENGYIAITASAAEVSKQRFHTLLNDWMTLSKVVSYRSVYGDAAVDAFSQQIISNS